MSFTIRFATVRDAKAVLEIYSYYVINTAISFEYIPPTLDEFEKRIESTLEKYPYLVAENDGKILGYAYAGAFRERRAYSHCCELSLYVDKGERGSGIGRALYERLEELLFEKGFENFYACIALPKENDCYLDTNSRDFHAHMGYKEVGLFSSCGKKFGKYYDMVYMEKIIK